MKRLLFSAVALLLGTAFGACTSMNDEPPPREKRELTAGDIARMSPAELDAYYRKEEQARRKTQSKSLVEGFNETKYSTQKRKKLYDVSHPVLLESEESIFPWRSGNRSEQLHDSMNTTGR